MPVPEVTPQQAQARLASANPPRLIDVREPEEWEICRIASAQLIPLSQFARLAAEQLTDPAEPLVIYCHHGMRSAHVTQYLLQHGFSDVVNLGGGIDAWAREVEPGMPLY